MSEDRPVIEIKLAGEKLFVIGNSTVTEGWIDWRGRELYRTYEVDVEGNEIHPPWREPGMVKRLAFWLVLRPIILRDYRLRAEGKRPDEMHWADEMAIGWGLFA